MAENYFKKYPSQDGYFKEYGGAYLPPELEKEMKKIAATVKRAVGFDKSRGDSFTIHQTRFNGTPTTQAGQVVREPSGGGGPRMYLRYGLILLALGVAVWVVRSIGQRLTQSPTEDPAQLQSNQPQQLDASDGDSQVAEGTSPEALKEGEEAGEEDLVLEDDMYTSKLSDEAKARIEARSEMFEEIQEQVEDHPEQTAELIRAWLVEDRSM